MWIDISYPISNQLALYPGDPAFSSSQQVYNAPNATITTSEISSCLHFGTHTDAPLHFIAGGKSIDQVDLESYIGLCQIIRVDLSQSKDKVIHPEHLPTIKAPRILLASNTFDYYQPFNEQFAVLSAETIKILIAHNCCLIGVDTPSVDPFNNSSSNNHLQLLSNNIAIIEGLKLQNISAGLYQMLAIPLAYQNLEASPLRVLIKPQGDSHA